MYPFENQSLSEVINRIPPAPWYRRWWERVRRALQDLADRVL